MNRKEVLEILENHEIEDSSSLFHNDYEDTVGNITITEVDSEGGGEGGGEYMMVVVKITNNDTQDFAFIKLEGTYNSWDSSEYDDLDSFTFVEPKEKTITVYKSTGYQDK